MDWTKGLRDTFRTADNRRKVPGAVVDHRLQCGQNQNSCPVFEACESWVTPRFCQT